MLKSDMISKVMDLLGGEASKATATAAIDAVLDSIVDGLKKDGEVRIAGFGTFKRKDRPERLGPKPGSPGEKITYPASTSVSFKAGKELKNRVA